MYEHSPHLDHYHQTAGLWDAQPRRRRLNRKGYAVLLVGFAFLCALFLAGLKLGLMIWHSPLTPQVANSAARIGTAAADAAMEEYKVPDKVRATVTEEAEALRRRALAGSAATDPEPVPAAR